MLLRLGNPLHYVCYIVMHSFFFSNMLLRVLLLNPSCCTYNVTVLKIYCLETPLCHIIHPSSEPLILHEVGPWMHTQYRDVSQPTTQERKSEYSEESPEAQGEHTSSMYTGWRQKLNPWHWRHEGNVLIIKPACTYRTGIICIKTCTAKTLTDKQLRNRIKLSSSACVRFVCFFLYMSGRHCCMLHHRF